MMEKEFNKEILKELNQLKATLWIGKNGCNENILEEIRRQVKADDLIKIKWLRSTDIDPEQIAKDSGTILIQVRGRTLVLANKRKLSKAGARNASAPDTKDKLASASSTGAKTHGAPVKTFKPHDEAAAAAASVKKPAKPIKSIRAQKAEEYERGFVSKKLRPYDDGISEIMNREFLSDEEYFSEDDDTEYRSSYGSSRGGRSRRGRYNGSGSFGHDDGYRGNRFRDEGHRDNRRRDRDDGEKRSGSSGRGGYKKPSGSGRSSGGKQGGFKKFGGERKSTHNGNRKPADSRRPRR